MRRSVPLETVVFTNLFPFPGAESNPTSWRQYVKKRLEPEVRAERERFYGTPEAHETEEGQYPGLDYSYWPHRRRLERWTQHRLFFAALDQTRLTPHEVKELCCWTGTLADKERYERKKGSKVLDTTGISAYHRMLCQQRSSKHVKCHECVPRHTDKHNPTSAIRTQRRSLPISARASRASRLPTGPRVSSPIRSAALTHSARLGPAETALLSQAQDNYEGELQSIGLALNQHLMAVAAAFEHSDDSVTMDPDFDMWLKDNEADTSAQPESPPFFHLPATLPDQISWETHL